MIMRVSAQAVARTILSNYEKIKPLTPEEAERIQFALEHCGVPDATTRLAAAFSRIVLKRITE